AAEDDALRTRQVVGHAEARPEDQRRPGVAVLRNAVAGLTHTVGIRERTTVELEELPGSRHDRADEAARPRPERNAGHRVDGRPVLTRYVERWNRPGIELVAEEVRHLLELVVLRLLPGEPHAV